MTGSSPSQFIPTRKHGTHVAGTVSAVKDNNLQVTGVAPQSKIISVSHELYPTPTVSSQLASGFAWAAKYGADIITNSWGDKGGMLYNELHSPILEDAIIDALTNGRNGRGCVITFCSGNYAPAMDYPGTFDDRIITVGAVNKNGIRANFSGYGRSLDVVAPGVDIWSTYPVNITTNLDGTSMATPHVAGIAALILSVNPCFTFQEVSNILEQTAQKLNNYSYGSIPDRPNGTWNSENRIRPC